MIQRVQHLFLFLNFLLAIYFCLMPIIQIDYILNGHNYVESISAMANTARIDGGSVVERDSYIFPIMMIGLSALFSFLAVFQFKNRKVQRGNCFINYFFMILFTLSIVRIWMGIPGVDVLGITTLSWVNVGLMILMLFLNYIAVVGINHDEALVRSADRLR